MRYGVMIVVGCLILGGCQSSYYQITDVSSDKTFYAKGWLSGMYGRYGSIRFQELGTGDRISLQNSRVREVTEAEATEAAQKVGPATRSTR